MSKNYKTAQAFRIALEDRLKMQANGNAAELVRLRRHIAFDRLLARFFCDVNPVWMLKGGYTFELRSYQHSRVTQDTGHRSFSASSSFAFQITGRFESN